MKQKVCTHCQKPLGEARLVVHAMTGVTGEFHVDGCFSAATAAAQASPGPWNPDIEIMAPTEGIARAGG